MSQDEPTHANPTTEPLQTDDAVQVMAWAKVGADTLEDIAANTLGFIPNGLAGLCDGLKRSPGILGRFFSDRWTNTTLKFITGATIGQVIAQDIARFVFRPAGFALGAFLGSSVMRMTTWQPHYQYQVGQLLAKSAPQAVAGGLLALASYGVAVQLSTISWSAWGALIAGGTGLGVGFAYKAMLLAATHTVTAANAASTRMNADRAKKFSYQLKVVSQEKMMTEVKAAARDYIESRYGQQATLDWDAFFEAHLQAVSANLYGKIDRHLNALTSRAVHGDFKALKQLATLYPRKGKDQALTTFLSRVFNQRALFQIQDAADTYYDVWRYRGLKPAVAKG